MTNAYTTPDFGGGLSLDELVGMTAGEIYGAELPNGAAFHAATRAAGRMLHAGMTFYCLMEVWADGHTVWHGPVRDDPVVVTPSGELIRTRD
jgi:hypothetical protein